MSEKQPMKTEQCTELANDLRKLREKMIRLRDSIPTLKDYEKHEKDYSKLSDFLHKGQLGVLEWINACMQEFVY